MTFAPNQQPDRMPRSLARIVFWISIICLVAFLWHVDSTPGHSSQYRWMMDFVAVAAVFVIWIIVSLVWKKVAGRTSNGADSSNRPVG